MKKLKTILCVMALMLSGVCGYDYYPIAYQIQRVVNFKKF